jgi:basic amino acid/polyamine antiporter, APA family
LKALERSLGLGTVTALSIGAMLGGGLFVLPGVAVITTGSGLFLAYLIAALSVMPAALAKAELATAMPVAGGTYTYIERTYGPLIGTIIGVGLWFSLLLKSSFALMGFGAYLAVFANIDIRVAGLLSLVLVTLINLIGVRKVGKLQIVLVALAIAGLTVVGLASIPRIDTQNFDPFLSNGLTGLWAGVAMVFMSYAGVTKIAAIAEEIKNPGRNIPLAIMIALSICSTFYICISFVLVGVLSPEALSGDLKPIHSLALSTKSPVMAVAAGVLGVLTMTSMANAGILAASRFPFAMSRDKLLPSALSSISQKYITPYVAILCTAALMTGVILFLDVTKIAKLASSLVVIAFMLTNLTVIILRESSAPWYKPSYKSPLYPGLQVAGLLIGAGLLVGLGLTGLTALAGIAVPGLFIYLVYGRRYSTRKAFITRRSEWQELLNPNRNKLQELDAVLPSEAAVVVSLLGPERSPEMLVEIGMSLSGGHKVEVIHLTDVPEQINLDAMLEEDPRVAAIRRRTTNIALAHEHDVEFDAVVTRDSVQTLYAISNRVHCNWVVLSARGHRSRGFLRHNPYSWLVNHLESNLAVYHDRGVRSLKEIMVLPEPGPNDALVVKTAERIAAYHQGRLTFMRFVSEDAGVIETQAAKDYLDQMAELCRDEPICKILRGQKALTSISDETAHFDLVIKGAIVEPSLWDFQWRRKVDQIAEQAGCSVLTLRSPRYRTHQDVSLDPQQSLTKALPLYQQLINRDCVRARIKVARKEALFNELAHTLAKTHLDVTENQISDALWQREKAQNTAVGHGVAMPHATVDSAQSTVLGVMTLDEPVDYNASDQQAVDVVFVTVGPPNDRATHLQLLATLAKRILESDFLESMRQAGADDQLFRVILSQKMSPTKQEPAKV